MSRDLLNPETVFAQAIEIDSPEGRAAFLDQACGNEPELRREVEKLVVDYFKAGRFLEEPAAHIVATVDDPITERPGTVIGPYKLLEQIGEGGFGVVFMAEQQEPIRRKVALKVLKPGMDTRRVIARFEAERQALALMDHPNIAKVLDAGTIGSEPDAPARAAETLACAAGSGRPYFVMELVKGVPITDFCDQNQLTPRERLELFIPVCQAVQHAHQKGIIHRDIKPTNVLVTLHDGTPLVKVIDFGIAKALGQQLTDKTLFTGFAQLLGTPLYMSPEQAALSNVDVDTRSDIYSLGVLLYELLTGTTPFDKERFKEAGYDEIRRIIREEEPPKPSTRMSTLGKSSPHAPRAETGTRSVPTTIESRLETIATQRKSDPKRLSQLFRGELDWIVMKALEKDRNRRYETANSLAQDIARYLHDDPVQACPPSVGYRLRKFARRNKVVLLTAVVIGSVLTLATLVSTWQALRATRAGRESRRLAAELALDKGQLLGEAGDPNLALLWLTRSLKLAPPEAVDLEAAIRTSLGAWRHQVNSLRMIMPHDGAVSGVAFRPDGKIVTASGRLGTGTVTVGRWDPATGQLGDTMTLSGEPVDSALAFSPNADYLLLDREDGTIQLNDLVTAKSVWEIRENGSYPASAVFSPDGKTLLIGYAMGPPGALLQAGKAQLLEVASGKPLGPALGHRRPVHAAAFHPNGKSFVTECGNWGDATEKVEARFWDLQGREIREPLEHDCVAPAVAFSPDGTKLLTGHWDRKAILWNLPTPNNPIILQHEGPVVSAAFSPDGKTLMTGSFDCTVRLWNLSGRSLGPPLRHGHMVGAMTFSPDGKSILVGSRGNAARLWSLATDGRAGLDETPDPTLFPVAVSPDGQTILTQDAEHTVVVRDVATKQPVGKPLPHQGRLRIGGTSVLQGQRHACSSDRRRVLTVDQDHVANLWDTSTGKLVAELKPVPERSTFFCAVFSPDSKLVVTGNHWSTAHVWDADTGKLIRNLEHERDGPVFNVAFDRNGRILLTGGADRAVRFWDPATGEQLGPPLMHHTGVIALALSLNGRTIVTGDTDQNVQLWDVASRGRLLHLMGHQGGVNDAAFSPDGRFVVTGSRDHTARLWDVASGKPIGPPLPHRGPVVRVAFVHDGKTVLTATQDQTLRSWQVPIAVSGTAEELELWAQVATGMELAADGGVRILDGAAWQERRQILLGTDLLTLPR